MLLLDIPGQVPSSFKTFRVGYDATGALLPRRAVGIHHPNGNVKRISYANDTCAHMYLCSRAFVPACAAHNFMLLHRSATSDDSADCLPRQPHASMSTC